MFSVVIPTFRRPRPLRAALASISACDPPPAEIIIVDGDPERTAEEVVREAAIEDVPVIRYITSPAGASRQRNVGVSEARERIIVFFDDDVIVDRAIFSALARVYDDATVIGATGRLIEPVPHRIGGLKSPIRTLLPRAKTEGAFSRFGYPRYVENPNEPKDVEFMAGCFMSGRREFVRKVPFDDEVSAVAEDEDFSYRLSRFGRIRYAPDAVVEHRKTGFTTRSRRTHDRLLMKNRIYLFHKNFEQTRRARLEFGVFMLVLLGHRLVNRDLAGAGGLIEGIYEAWCRRLTRPSA